MNVSKQIAALVSILASIVLSAVKVVIGVLTGSLSILAEAADAILDLVAAGVTMLVVHIADVPPDENHPYGHARAEHLGALAQTVLLVVTAVVVLIFATERIFIAPQIPTVTGWSLLVIVLSLGVNGVRIVILNRAAQTQESETLTANIANFANDMFGSLAVLVALSLIALQPWLGLPFWLIARLDALAATCVAFLALLVAWRLGNQAIAALMDDVPPDLSRSLTERVAGLPDVVPDSIELRTRFVGTTPYVEVTVGTPRGRSLEEAHRLADSVEHAVRTELDTANVLVHVEPARTQAEPYATAVYSVAQELGLRVHHLDLYQLTNEILVKLDLELPGSMTLAEAHTRSDQLEAAICAELPGNARVIVHLEPRRDHVQPAVRYPPLNDRVQEALRSLPDTALIIQTETILTDLGMVVTLRCQFPPQTSLTEVHDKMAGIEHNLRRVLPDIVSVQIDPEIASAPS